MSCKRCGRENYWTGPDEPPCKCKTDYVIGFLFNFDNRVLLINKTKPEWQKGLLNGIGGKIEKGESPVEAMIREFEEEAGITVGAWRNFATLNGKDYTIHLYSALYLPTLGTPESMTEETIEWVDLDEIPYERTVPNLRWLLPVARYMKSDYHAKFTNRVLTAAEGQK